MKFILTILALTTLTNFTFAQLEKATYKSVADNFEKNYNSDKFEEIFANFSPEMQKALPLDKTKEFLNGLKQQAGKITKREFIKYEQTYASYKTNFEKLLFTVNISIDNNSKINGFFVKPYEKNSITEHLPINALEIIYPNDIAEIIYSKSNKFPNHTQLSIAIIQNGKTNYYGVIRENDSILPINNQNKIFEIGSLTKVFTSTVLASLVIENKIKLTEFINIYYPFIFKNNVKITFESLANHTSGLPRLPNNLNLSNEINPYKNYGKNELTDYLKNDLKLENETMKTYAYSNLGAGLLGYSIELSQKTSFQKLLQQQVFDKYKMKSTFTSSH